MSEGRQPPPPHRPRRARRAVAGAALALVAAAVVYGVTSPGKGGASACPGAAGETARLAPLIHGDVAALSLARPSRTAPDVAFKGPDGRALTLADLKGRTLLVNFWATWCVPCREEMPALAALQKAQGGPGFEVVTVNVDTARLDRPAAFFRDHGIDDLTLYADPSGDALQTLKEQGGLLGLPTTLLVSREGCELGRLAGPAPWNSPDGQALVAALKGAGGG